MRPLRVWARLQCIDACLDFRNHTTCDDTIGQQYDKSITALGTQCGFMTSGRKFRLTRPQEFVPRASINGLLLPSALTTLVDLIQLPVEYRPRILGMEMGVNARSTRADCGVQAGSICGVGRKIGGNKI